MSITAQSADGVLHQFPDGTDPHVIDITMKGYALAQQPNTRLPTRLARCRVAQLRAWPQRLALAATCATSRPQVRAISAAIAQDRQRKASSKTTLETFRLSAPCSQDRTAHTSTSNSPRPQVATMFQRRQPDGSQKQLPLSLPTSRSAADHWLHAPRPMFSLRLPGVSWQDNLRLRARAGVHGLKQAVPSRWPWR